MKVAHKFGVRRFQSLTELVEHQNPTIHSEFQIPGTKNHDPNPCLLDESTYPMFQVELQNYMENLERDFESGRSYTSFKFGDGDYNFLKRIPSGSAQPGKRAVSRNLSKSEMSPFITGSKKCNKYFCEIYPENRKMFQEVIGSDRNTIPAEFNYGLVSNKWLFKEFGSSIGIIGASEKVDLIRQLMQYPEYQEYLGLREFSDYIKVPQKFACDDLESLEISMKEQFKEAKSKLFLFGIGHVKSGIAWKLNSFWPAIYLDIGSGIDAIAGIIDEKRPYFGDWTNHQLRSGFDYSKLDLLQLEKSKVKFLN
ncbi:hypothetical protein A1sIA79_00160 [Candidatus Planktophila versatilis]|uniref:Uncharacterized protein n=2 Tax=Candidatus Planktophila versatilis TaxID=1884905 RepID=A0ABM6MCT6_9ACTN|nr:hypothetical protein A1sIA79_00160 [Candidatus Planktophila versatilis]